MEQVRSLVVAIANGKNKELLSNFYTDIYLFRYDDKRKEIYILAGETLGITIRENGRWEFDDDTEA